MTLHCILQLYTDILVTRMWSLMFVLLLLVHCQAYQAMCKIKHITTGLYVQNFDFCHSVQLFLHGLHKTTYSYKLDNIPEITYKATPIKLIVSHFPPACFFSSRMVVHYCYQPDLLLVFMHSSASNHPFSQSFTISAAFLPVVSTGF